MNEFHVGRGTNRGALTVFPIWAEVAHPVSYTMDHSVAVIGELTDGPAVGSLTVANTGGVPLLLLEGQLLAGGMQHRMVARTTLLGAGAEMPVDVVCVEQGRWRGSGGHATSGQRAAARVRAGLRAANRQGEVWRRVAGYDAELGANATSSYIEHVDRGEARVRAIVAGLRPFPGQVGMLIGIAGQPLAAEVFDSPRMLATQFSEILRAGAMDAIGQPAVETPSRRARRFIDRALLVERRVDGPAGIARAVAGRTQYVDLTGVNWNHHELVTLLTNPRHELALAA